MAQGIEEEIGRAVEVGRVKSRGRADLRHGLGGRPVETRAICRDRAACLRQWVVASAERNRRRALNAASAWRTITGRNAALITQT